MEIKTFIITFLLLLTVPSMRGQCMPYYRYHIANKQTVDKKNKKRKTKWWWSKGKLKIKLIE